MEERKRAVLLKNISSPYVCEAVLIIRDCAPIKQADIIKEAERLINDLSFDLYDDEVCVVHTKRKFKAKSAFWWTFAAVSVAAAAFVYILTRYY